MPLFQQAHQDGSPIPSHISCIGTARCEVLEPICPTLPRNTVSLSRLFPSSEREMHGDLVVCLPRCFPTELGIMTTYAH